MLMEITERNYEEVEAALSYLVMITYVVPRHLGILIAGRYQEREGGKKARHVRSQDLLLIYLRIVPTCAGRRVFFRL